MILKTITDHLGAFLILLLFFCLCLTIYIFNLLKSDRDIKEGKMSKYTVLIYIIYHHHFIKVPKF